MNFRDHKKWEGQVLRGIIIDEGSVVDEDGDPVLETDEEAPNIIVNDLDPREVSRGDRMKVKVKKAHENVMFGEVADSNFKSSSEKKAEKKNSSDYQVEFSMFGYTFTSDTLQDEEAAEDLKEFLQTKMDKEIRVEKTR